MADYSKPKVSVVIPTYNRPEFLERALASVMAQTFRDFEIIIVQNGRGRSSQKIAEKFLERGITVRYFYLPAANAVRARNLGIQQAEGDFVAFLDDDDEWMPEKLAKQMAFFEANPGAGIVATHARVMKEGAAVQDPRAVFGEEKINVFHLIEKGCVIYSLSCAMIRKACFAKTGLMNPKYKIANDYEFYFRMANRYPVCMVREPLVIYHRHHHNAIRNVKETAAENIRVLREVKKTCRETWTGREISDAIEKQKNFYIRSVYAEASDAMEEKQYFKALAWFFSAITKDPFVGRRIPWGRVRGEGYKLLRPYAAIFYCAMLAVRDFFSARKAAVK